MIASGRPRRIALVIGDPAGIGCEIVLKALAAPAVRDAGAQFAIVGDAALVADGNVRFGTHLPLRFLAESAELQMSSDAIDVLGIGSLDAADFAIGRTSAAAGRALVAYGEAAIGLAARGTVDVVVAAPHNQTSVRRAGIPFDGWGNFAARVCGTPPDDSFLMALSSRFTVTHVTLHEPLRDAIGHVTHERVLAAIRATAAALAGVGVAAPRIAVSGLNPHASENGLWGDEEASVIAPAIADARAAGLDVAGPFGADVMFAHGGYDAYVVMLHDQGHIPVKLEGGGAGIQIGLPILFASVAHGSAHDIAGRGIADPASLINAIVWSCRPAAGRVSA